MAARQYRTTKLIVQLYEKYIWVRVPVLALMLLAAWAFFFLNGRDALIDETQMIKRSAVYERMEVSTQRDGDLEAVNVYFADGTQARAEVNNSALHRALLRMPAGEVLEISLDESGEYLLGVRHGNDVLMDGAESARCMNGIARGWMAMGVLMCIGAAVQVVRDAVQGMRRRRRRRR